MDFVEADKTSQQSEDVATIDQNSEELSAKIVDTNLDLSKNEPSLEPSAIPLEPSQEPPSSPIPPDSTSPVPLPPSPQDAPLTNQIPIQTPEDKPSKDSNGSKKGDDKSSIYKALAIKLKKELVKSREEYQKYRDTSFNDIKALKENVESLEQSLESERQTNINTITTLESRNKILKEKLDSSEIDLQSLQNEFENYKVQASRIMQQSNHMQSNTSKTFEEERYKQLKVLNEGQEKRIAQLEAQLSTSLTKNEDLERDLKFSQQQLALVQEKVELYKISDHRCEMLSRENENLKLALKQYRSKLKDPTTSVESLQYADDGETKQVANKAANSDILAAIIIKKPHEKGADKEKATDIGSMKYEKVDPIDSRSLDDKLEESVPRLSPSTSVKDDSQTNSSSSFDGSTSGYVHIKPATFEIISRSSVLEDAQNQIDNLTKAYLDSENTNSLLSEQVGALKEEIRRMERRVERLDLAENLEYLKNIVFKFISLDSGQIEQKQRLIPVLSTVLKLSPDETAKLNLSATADKTSVAGSFFKL